MPVFTYRHKGTVNADWNTDTIEAVDKKDAEQKLDKIYGIQRDKTGKQVNSDAIKVEVV